MSLPEEKNILLELSYLRTRIASLEKALADLQAKPQEILEEIERIWREDPEVNENAV